MDLIKIEQEFFKYRSTRKKGSAGSCKAYRSAFRQAWAFAREMGVELDTEALDTTWADLLVQFWCERPLMPRTVHRNVGALRALFHYARRQRWTENDPFRDLELPDLDRVERPILTNDELNALVQSAESILCPYQRDMSRALLLTQIAIGTRISELLALSIGDVDFDQGVIRVRRGKGSKAREIPLGPRAQEALRTWLASRRTWLDTRAGDRRIKGEEPEALWLADRGRKPSTAAVSALLDSLCERARVTKTIRIHDLRTLTARRWKREGVPIETISHWMGHADLAQTRKYLGDTCADTRQWSKHCDLPEPAAEQSALAGPEGVPASNGAIAAGGPVPVGQNLSSPTGHPGAGLLYDPYRALQEMQELQQRLQFLQHSLAASGALPSPWAYGPSVPVSPAPPASG